MDTKDLISRWGHVSSSEPQWQHMPRFLEGQTMSQMMRGKSPYFLMKMLTAERKRYIYSVWVISEKHNIHITAKILTVKHLLVDIETRNTRLLSIII